MDHSAHSYSNGKLKLSHLFPLLFQNKLQMGQILKWKKWKSNILKENMNEYVKNPGVRKTFFCMAQKLEGMKEANG